MPWLRMAWLWSWCFVALSLPLNDLLRSVRYQDAAGGDERCHTARAHSVPRGCARISAGHLPGGAHAVVVIGNDRDVHGAAAVRCRAQLRQNQGLELRLCLRRLVGLRLERLDGHRPFFKIAMRQRLSAGTFFCACCTSVPRTRCPHAASQRVTRFLPRRRRPKRRRVSKSAERAAEERVRSKLRT